MSNPTLTKGEWIDRQKEQLPGTIVANMAYVLFGRYALKLPTAVAFAVPLNLWIVQQSQLYSYNPVLSTIPLYLLNRYIFRIERNTSIAVPVALNAASTIHRLWNEHEMDKKIVALLKSKQE